MKEELLGLEPIESKILKCSGCGFKMAEVELIQTNEARIKAGQKEQTVQYRITNCPKCGENSFWSDFFNGRSIAGSTSDDYTLEPVDIQQEGKVIKVILKCQNKR